MISQSPPFAESALQGRLDWLDLGSGNARCEVYGGTRPASGAVTSESILVTITLAKPSGTIDVGLLTLVANAAYALASSSGAATWARWYNGNNEFAFDCDAGGPASTAEVKLSENTILYGAKVSLVSAVFS